MLMTFTYRIVCVLALVESVVSLTKTLQNGNITVSVIWSEKITYGEPTEFICETISPTEVNVSFLWILPNISESSYNISEANTSLCTDTHCVSALYISTVDFHHEGIYVCQTEFGEIDVYLEVESLCPYKRFRRATSNSTITETNYVNTSYECMKLCESFSECVGIMFKAVDGECCIHNETNLVYGNCEGDFFGYFYEKICPTGGSCYMEKKGSETMGIGTLIDTHSDITETDCMELCLNISACNGMDYNFNNKTCRLFDSGIWIYKELWARQGYTQCDYFEKPRKCDEVLECLPPRDLKGWEYHGKINESKSGPCKNWRDTEFSYLTEHQNFCRKIRTFVSSVSCVNEKDDLVDCLVPNCANIEISSNEVIFGDTVILVTNVTWHPSFNVTGFQWSKNGQALDNSSRKYEIGNLPLPSLIIYNATFEDDASYRIEVYITHYGFEDTAHKTYNLIISGHIPVTTLKIRHTGHLLGESLLIGCELLEPPAPNILYYRLERKRESDLSPEILKEMSSNETFDNTSVFVAQFFTQNVTIFEYSEYRCTTTNLISTEISSHYLTIKSGESKHQRHVYIPNLDKVLYRTASPVKSQVYAEMECQKRNGTLYQITSLERQIYLEKLFREHWIKTSGNMYAFISGKRSGNEWKINNSVPSFTYWNVSFPDNNFDHNCIAQFMIPSYRWINVPCTDELPYICELPPFCEEAHLPNATVEPGSTYIFTSRDYNCIGGNKMTPHLECLEHLQWEGGCEPIVCSIPEGVHSHALINKTYYFNETADFQCDYGFKEDSGMSSLICGENNSWNNEPLKCTRIVCDVVNVTNARIINTNITTTALPFGTSIEYECLPGFILSSGGYNNTCLLSGAWSNLPGCSAPACPKESINSSIYVINHLDGYNISDNMSLSCNTGYRHGGGDLNRTCQGSGVWSAPLPQCNRCTCPCDRVHPVQNLTAEELNNKIEELKKELVVNTRTLSSFIRKRTSASDERPSATGVGVILGVGILTFLCAIIFIPDIPKLKHDLRNNAVIQYLNGRFFSR